MGNASKQFIKKLRNRRGQALVEYILILVVVIAMVLGGIYQLNKAFQFWAESYFGEYLTCLLETGELPTLSAQADPNSECAAAYQKFQFTLAASTGDQNSNGGSTNNPGGGNESSPSGASGSQGANSGSRSTPSGNAERGGSANSRDAGISAGTASRFRTNSGKSGSSDSGIDQETVGNSSVASIKNENGAAGVSTRVAVGADFRGKQKREEDRDPIKTTASVKSGDGRDQKGGLIPVRKPAKVTADEADTEGLTFGFFLRYLIIGAIIIAIIIFIGGQALQVSKSME